MILVVKQVVVNAVGAIIAAVGIYRGVRSWGRILGLLIAGGALIGYVISSAVGLPGLPVYKRFDPIGVLSLIIESLFILVALYTLTRPAAKQAA